MEVENDMDDFILIIQELVEKNDFYSILSVLNDKKNAGEIVLYAGTYSLEMAIERYGYYDNAVFYVYTVPGKEGYCIYKSNRACGIVEDNDIFKFFHRRFYNKSHLSNCDLGENDCRSGKFFCDKKGTKAQLKEGVLEGVVEIVFNLIAFGIGAVVFGLFGDKFEMSNIDPDLVIWVGMLFIFALVALTVFLIWRISKKRR